MSFSSTILLLPGLGNSGPDHWQTQWENKFGFYRVNQKDWDKPVCADWIDTIDMCVQKYELGKVILVAHSLACCTVAFWAAKYKRMIKGALLVGPSDTEADSYPAGTSGFAPIQLDHIPFPTLTVASTNDPFVTLERAKFFSNAWGSENIIIGEAGHINAASGLGLWEQGLDFLKILDEQSE